MPNLRASDAVAACYASAPHLFLDESVIHFVDNNGARDSHISGYSRSDVVGSILAATKLIESKIGMWCWFDRVPTDSNIADGPSRDAHELVIACGFSRVQPTFPSGWSPSDGTLPSLDLEWHWDK